MDGIVTEEVDNGVILAGDWFDEEWEFMDNIVFQRKTPTIERGKWSRYFLEFIF